MVEDDGDDHVHALDVADLLVVFGVGLEDLAEH